MALSGDGCFRVIVDIFDWMVVDGFRCLQIVLGGFRWFSEMGSFSS